MTGDAGVTLVELMIAIVITGFIGSATAGSFLVFMTSSERSGDEQAIARDQFWLNSWFLADAQSAEAWTTSPGSPTCLDVPGDDADHQAVAQLSWGDESADPATPEYEANYRAERASSDEPWQLVRYFCESGQSASRALVVLSLSLTPAPSIDPTPSGRITFRLTSGIDDTSELVATGGPHVGP
ncbi:MAG: type II secretion system protein [Dehalococcoidia bacterium]